MAIDVDSLTDYSFAQIAKAAKHAMIHAAVGGNTLSIEGKTIGRITPDQAKSLYEWAVQMQNDAAAGEDGGNVLVKYGERV